MTPNNDFITQYNGFSYVSAILKRYFNGSNFGHLSQMSVCQRDHLLTNLCYIKSEL